MNSGAHLRLFNPQNAKMTNLIKNIITKIFSKVRSSKLMNIKFHYFHNLIKLNISSHTINTCM